MAEPSKADDAAAPEASASAASGASDTRRTLDAFLLAAYRGAVAVRHEQAVPIAAIAKELEIAERLAHKIAAFLESEGLLDYDDQAIEITVEGMLRTEEVLRGPEERARVSREREGR